MVTLVLLTCLAFLAQTQGVFIDDDCEMVLIEKAFHNAPASKVFQPATQAECISACRADGNCLAASLHRKALNCTLHYQVPPLQGNTENVNQNYDLILKRCPSKVKDEDCQMLELLGRQPKASDIMTRYPVKKSEDCRLLCKLDPGCAAASFEVPYSLCYVHYNLGYILHDESDMFYKYYLKVCQPSIEVCSSTVTQDARQVNDNTVYKRLEIITSNECKEACEEDDSCKAAAFAKPEKAHETLVMPPKTPAYCVLYAQDGVVVEDDTAKGKFVHIKKTCDTISIRKPAVDHCESSPCLGDAMCRSMNNTYQCYCEVGYEYRASKGCKYVCKDNFGKKYFEGEEERFQCSSYRCDKLGGLTADLECQSSDGRCLPESSNEFPCIINGQEVEQCTCFIDHENMVVEYFPLLDPEIA